MRTAAMALGTRGTRVGLSRDLDGRGSAPRGRQERARETLASNVGVEGIQKGVGEGESRRTRGSGRASGGPSPKALTAATGRSYPAWLALTRTALQSACDGLAGAGASGFRRERRRSRPWTGGCGGGRRSGTEPRANSGFRAQH